MEEQVLGVKSCLEPLAREGGAHVLSSHYPLRGRACPLISSLDVNLEGVTERLSRRSCAFTNTCAAGAATLSLPEGHPQVQTPATASTENPV